MDTFTPGFVLQLLLAVGSAGAVYGAVRADLRNMARDIEEERRLREAHAKQADDTHHDIREEIQVLKVDLALLQGKQTLAVDLLEAIRK